MRLLVVTQYFWPENFRINDLATELVRRGHDVIVLTGCPNYPTGAIYPEFAAHPETFAHFNGALVVRVPLVLRGQGRLRLVLNYLSFAVAASTIGVWKLRGLRFDAIFAYEPSPITVGIPAAILRAMKQAPVAFWVLDLWPDTLQAIGVVRSGMLLRWVGRLVSFIYHRCDLILAQSRSFIPQISKYSKSDACIEYFPSWAESVFDLDNVAPATEVPVQAHAFNVMFAGNIGEAQDFPTILAAAERLRDQSRIRWLIVGDGRKAAWVSEEIIKRGLEKCVLMLGKYPVERMPSFYKQADTLLVSLKDDPVFSMTIPGKLQSYLAAGKPVIAVLNGEGADVVRRARAGVACAAGDVAGLAEAVLQLAQSPREELSAMGMNALHISSKEFGRDRLISQLENWLENLAGDSRRTI